MNNLASIYSDLGGYSDAQQLRVQALDIRKHMLGGEHPDTLVSINNLALTYLDLGQYNNAQKLEVQALDIYKRVLGEEHPDTLASMGNLALIYLRLDQWEEAKELYSKLKAVGIAERTLGDQHPDTQLYRRSLESMLTDRDTESTAQTVTKAAYYYTSPMLWLRLRTSLPSLIAHSAYVCFSKDA